MDDETTLEKLGRTADICPAFKDGCPYATEEIKRLINGNALFASFMDHCPFKEVKTISEARTKLHEIPKHSGDPNQNELFLELFNRIHWVSKIWTDDIGECPMFATDRGCPFKTLVATKEMGCLKQLDAFSLENNEAAVHERLSKQLKIRTRKAHKEASTVHYVRDFLKGRVEEKLHRELIAGFYFIYKALEEECCRWSDHPQLKKILIPEQLSRKDALIKDLAFYYGEDWRDEIEMNEPVTTYVEQIREVANKNPMLLIAHHYTRYLGDLSGGQDLKKAAVKSFGLEDGDGTNFFVFEKIESIQDFKKMYRAQLDSMVLSEEEVDCIVEEAKYAFRLNIDLFKELDMLRGYIEEVIYPGDGKNFKKDNLCPFMGIEKGIESNANRLQSGKDKGFCPYTFVKRHSLKAVFVFAFPCACLLASWFVGLHLNRPGMSLQK